MKKLYIILILSITSCNSQESSHAKLNEMETNNKAPYNIEHIGDSTLYDYNNFPQKVIDNIDMSLSNQGFIYAKDSFFLDRVKTVYNCEVKNYKENNIVLRPTMFPEIVIKDKKFIIIQDSESDNEYNINDNLIFAYNNYIFYNNRESLYFLEREEPQLLNDLVINYGYNGDKDLVQFVFKDFNFEDVASFHDLIFDYNIDNKMFYIRKGILDDIEDIIYDGPTEDFSYAKEGDGYSIVYKIIKKIEGNRELYSNPDSTIALLYEKELLVGIQGGIESELINNPKYQDYLKENNYFGFERLKKYVEYIYLTPEEIIEEEEEEEKFIGATENSSILKGTIKDSDGYVNLRDSRGTYGNVIEKIKNGEEIIIKNQEGNWWLIESTAGESGFVHKSRIVLNK